MRQALALGGYKCLQPLRERPTQRIHLIVGVNMVAALLEQGLKLPLHVKHPAPFEDRVLLEEIAGPCHRRLMGQHVPFRCF